MGEAAGNVVDFFVYRDTRERTRLPLLDVARPQSPVSPFRPLDDRQIAHRLVMLKHLTLGDRQRLPHRIDRARMRMGENS